MTKKLKRILVGLVASAMCVTGSMGAILASAAGTSASWAASRVNVYGAPSSSSTSPTVEVMQKANGAKAVCNSVTHSNDDADTGYTYINCLNYTMSQVTIVNTDTAYLYPAVGSPLVDITVRYKVTASTPFYPDVFWSYGTISKL